MGNVTRRTPVKTVGTPSVIPSTADPAPAAQPQGAVFKRDAKGNFLPAGR